MERQLACSILNDTGPTDCNCVIRYLFAKAVIAVVLEVIESLLRGKTSPTNREWHRKLFNILSRPSSHLVFA